MITVLVVNARGDNRPRNGFLSLAKHLGRDVSDPNVCWVRVAKSLSRLRDTGSEVAIKKGALSRALKFPIRCFANPEPHPETPLTSATWTDALISAAPWPRFAGCVRGLQRSSGRLLRECARCRLRDRNAS